MLTKQVILQSNLLKQPPLYNDHLPKTTNAESARPGKFPNIRYCIRRPPA